MAGEGTVKSEGGVVGRLAGRGEEAMSRLLEEVGRSTRVTETLGRAMEAKGKLDSASRAALAQMGIAAADEVATLRRQVEALEQRLEKLEGRGARKPAAKRKPRTAKKPPEPRQTTPREAVATPPREAGRGAATGPG